MSIIIALLTGKLKILITCQVAKSIPANTQRDKHVIITSKQRFDVIITCLLCVFAGMQLISNELQ